jgi:hypothetical protein
MRQKQIQRIAELNVARYILHYKLRRPDAEIGGLRRSRGAREHRIEP